MMILFGLVTGLVLIFPLMLGMFEEQSNYLPFGIGTVLGIISSFILAYAFKFHT